MVLRKLIAPAACFLLGGLGLALAQGVGVLRPEVFVTLPWTWTGVQQFTDGDFALKGSASGTTTLKANATAGSTTITFPASTDTAAVLGTAQTWTALQQFNNADFALKGSTSGTTTLKANATAGSTTITFPAANDTAAVLGTAQTWTATQSYTPQSLTISTATFTPAAASGNNIKFTLVHASCPCTLANPSGTPVAGTSGVIEVTQSATGSDTIGTWGSSYLFAGGTSTILLSTAANAVDTLTYYVRDSTHIVLTVAAKNATH